MFFRVRRFPSAFCAAAVLVSCGLEPAGERNTACLRFTVIDVGQGLAQLAQAGDTAAAFDLGPAEASGGWRTAYEQAGRPFLAAVSISHAHLDHWGGLRFLDSAVRWSGVIMTGPGGDTVVYRNAVPPFRRERVRFRKIAAGDTAALLNGVFIRCLWPAAGDRGSGAPDSLLVNRESLVFRVTSGITSALLTSDIDSCAAETLAEQLRDRLAAQLFVVPHHGSAGSVCPLFYGYVAPSLAVISCGKDNPYGHPSADVLLWMSQMGVPAEITSGDGTCCFESNGYYWWNSMINEAARK